MVESFLKGINEVIDLDLIKDYIDRFLHFGAVELFLAFAVGLLKVCFGPDLKTTYVAIIVLFVLEFMSGFLKDWLDPDAEPSLARFVSGCIKAVVYSSVIIAGFQMSFFPLLTMINGAIETLVAIAEFYGFLLNVKGALDMSGKDLPLLDDIIKIIKNRKENILK